MKKRMLTIILALVLILSLLVSCGGDKEEDKKDEDTAAEEEADDGEDDGDDGDDGEAADGEAIKISILTSQGSYRDVFVSMSEKMEELYGYDIEWQVLPDDQYYVLVKSKVATGEVPDIIEYNTPSNNIELNAHEKVVPLDDQPWVERLVNPDLLKDPDDGKIYAMPRDSGTFFGGIYYNKTVLEDLGVSTEQPKTIEELKERMNEIKEKSNGEVTPVYFSNSPTEAWTTQIYCTLGFAVHNYPDDTEIFEKLLNNELTFPEAPGFVEVLTDFKSFFDEGLANENHLSADYDSAQEAIGTGEAAMVFHGEWFPPLVTERYPDTELGSWIIPYNGNDIMGTGAYVRGFFVMKDGEQVDETLEFMDRWSQPEIQDMYFEDQSGFPAFEDVDGGEVDPSVEYLVDNYLSEGKYTYQINDPMGAISSIWPELWKLYQDMLASDRDPKEILEEWQVIYEDYMQQLGHEGF